MLPTQLQVTSTSGTVSVDTSLISGVRNEIALPVRADTQAAQVVSSILGMCGISDDSTKYALQVAKRNRKKNKINKYVGASQRMGERRTRGKLFLRLLEL